MLVCLEWLAYGLSRAGGGFGHSPGAQRRVSGVGNSSYQSNQSLQPRAKGSHCQYDSRHLYAMFQISKAMRLLNNGRFIHANSPDGKWPGT